MGFVDIFLIGFIAALTPGPDILLVLQSTLCFGAKAGLCVLFGIATGWVLFLGIVYFGLAHFLSHPIAQICIGMFGAIYLTYTAYRILIAPQTYITLSDLSTNPKFAESNTESNAKSHIAKPKSLESKIVKSKKVILSTPYGYFKGLFVNLSNPKAIVFFGIVIAPYMDTHLTSSIIVLFISLWSAFLSVIIVAVFCRDKLMQKDFVWQRILVWIDRICAVLFIGFGLLLLWHSIQNLKTLF
ncbi:LysE family translocator [uncultured Helicobacter sp.]|uniref:LysE family translocator n=1 Tax=uncultured Helicobacter sp. TaxID=175537 RepID=UPI0025832EC0|nr:LysE family translocator [uncultured Helicobacter sp.]